MQHAGTSIDCSCLCTFTRGYAGTCQPLQVIHSFGQLATAVWVDKAKHGGPAAVVLLAVSLAGWLAGWQQYSDLLASGAQAAASVHRAQASVHGVMAAHCCMHSASPGVQSWWLGALPCSQQQPSQLPSHSDPWLGWCSQVCWPWGSRTAQCRCP
jgi:hypothetical protein